MNRMKALFPGALYWSRLPCVVAACALCCGIVASSTLFAPEQTAGSLNSTLYHYVFSLATITALICGILSKSTAFRSLFFFVAGFLLHSHAELRYEHFRHQMEQTMQYSSYLQISGTITGRSTERLGSHLFEIRVENSSKTPVSALLRGKKIRCIHSSPPPSTGRVQLTGVFSLAQKNALPFGFNESAYFQSQRLWGTLEVDKIVKHERSPRSLNALFSLLRTRSSTILESAGKNEITAIFKAAFLGQRDELSKRVQTAFRRAGIFHLLSISGFHAGLLFLAFSTLLALTGMSSTNRTFTSLGFLWVYLFFIGLIPSLFRATVMFSCFGITVLFQKKNHVLQSMGLAALLWLILSPTALFSPGFQLSFCATAGILLLNPAINKLLSPNFYNRYLQFLSKFLLSALSVSLSAFLFTAPILIYHFGVVSLFGILFNMPAIILMSGTMWLLFAGLICGMLYIPLSYPTVLLAQFIMRFLVYLADLSRYMPLSELSHYAPPLHHILIFYLLCLGLCAIKTAFRTRYGAIAPGVFLLFLLVTHLFVPQDTRTELIRTTSNSSTITGILWPDNTVWLLGYGEPHELNRMVRSTIEPWFHHRGNPNTTLLLFTDHGERAAHQALHSFKTDPYIIVAPEIPSDQRSVNSGYNYREFLGPLKLITPSGHSAHLINEPESGTVAEINFYGGRLLIPITFYGPLELHKREGCGIYTVLTESGIIDLHRFL